MPPSNSFHLSLITDNLPRQRAFYTEVLGCKLARTAEDFEDIDFFGNQLTFHRREASLALPYETLHFGAMVSVADFELLYARLLAAATQFVIEPLFQAAGGPDERRKMVFLDPSGYAVELKCYVDPTRALARDAAYARATR